MKSKKSLAPWHDQRYFHALLPYMKTMARGNLKTDQIFVLSLKASIAKCFEFNTLARRRMAPDEAFFWIPALRGTCEDLILLNFIKGLPKAECQRLMMLLMSHDLQVRTDCQDKFFTAIRPQQPVLRVKDAANTIAKIEIEMRAIWNRHGWPNLQRGGIPQIRQIAEKQGQAVLGTLYDYLYRLTSGLVHFSVQALMRTGWGPSKEQFSFSTKNFYRYHLSFAQLYGAFLFCLYFECFEEYLQPSRRVLSYVGKIREAVWLHPRWPEMVTFEEMNIPSPDEHLGQSMMRHPYSFMQSQEKKRLLE